MLKVVNHTATAFTFQKDSITPLGSNYPDVVCCLHFCSAEQCSENINTNNYEKIDFNCSNGVNCIHQQ